MLNKDYREMLQCLSDEGVKFLVVGAYALAVHGFPRATKDIDFFVWANPENARSLFRALDRFGAPLENLSHADFASEGAVFQIGVGPRRIDIITRIDGVKFEDAYARRLTVQHRSHFFYVPIAVVDRCDAPVRMTQHALDELFAAHAKFLRDARRHRAAQVMRRPGH
jgi:hypothetical protein